MEHKHLRTSSTGSEVRVKSWQGLDLVGNMLRCKNGFSENSIFWNPFGSSLLPIVFDFPENAFPGQLLKDVFSQPRPICTSNQPPSKITKAGRPMNSKIRCKLLHDNHDTQN